MEEALDLSFDRLLMMMMMMMMMMTVHVVEYLSDVLINLRFILFVSILLLLLFAHSKMRALQCMTRIIKKILPVFMALQFRSKILYSALAPILIPAHLFIITTFLGTGTGTGPQASCFQLHWVRFFSL